MISYTLPCHKRQEDLSLALQSVLLAQNTFDGEVEIVVADYGNPVPLMLPFSVNRIVVPAPYFHMAHARNVGIRAAKGEIICAFVADQLLAPEFFTVVNGLLHPGSFLVWQETYVFYRNDILATGGFDERFELYGPEGKELAERLERRGLHKIKLPKNLVAQLPTGYKSKLTNYAQPLSRREMHHIGMDVWAACGKQLVANEGHTWGDPEGPVYRDYPAAYVAEIRERIEQKKREHEEKMKALVGVQS